MTAVGSAVAAGMSKHVKIWNKFSDI